jgi:hypothetical protein
MPKGQTAEIGTERWSQNGYLTVKTEEGWRYKHHLIAEEKLGRPLEPTERVVFGNGDRKDFDPDNIWIEVSKKRRNRIFMLEQKVIKLSDELEEIRNELQTLRESES